MPAEWIEGKLNKSIWSHTYSNFTLLQQDHTANFLVLVITFHEFVLNYKKCRIYNLKFLHWQINAIRCIVLSLTTISRISYLARQKCYTYSTTSHFLTTILRFLSLNLRTLGTSYMRDHREVVILYPINLFLNSRSTILLKSLKMPQLSNKNAEVSPVRTSSSFRNFPKELLS